MRLYTDGCVVDSGTGLMGLCIREVQSEDEELYTEDELEDLANLPTDSAPDDLGDLNSEDYDDIDPNDIEYQWK